MSDLSNRLREERQRLGLSQQQMATLGGIKVNAQSNYETGKRTPDAEYLEALAMHDVDVSYVLTGHRMLMQSFQRQEQAQALEAADGRVVEEEASRHESGADSEVRALSREEAALLDDYKKVDASGRAAFRVVMDALGVAGALAATTKAGQSQGAEARGVTDRTECRVTSVEAELLDNFEATNERGRGLARGVLQALVLMAAARTFAQAQGMPPPSVARRAGEGSSSLPGAELKKANG